MAKKSAGVPVSGHAVDSGCSRGVSRCAGTGTPSLRCICSAAVCLHSNKARESVAVAPRAGL